MLKRVLVFPCGSEIGLEIHRSLIYSTHFELIGGSSVDDHGRFVYEKYVGNIPFHDHPDFLDKMRKIVSENKIDAIYPTMDAVVETLMNAIDIGCLIIGSDARTTAVCASKKLTHELFSGVISMPDIYSSLDKVEQYPIFIKPDRGYGSRNSLRADSYEEAEAFLVRNSDQKMLLLEYLPGREWTIDCFSDRNGIIRFSAARDRKRISNGISVNTTPSNEFSNIFEKWTNVINSKLKLRGAWFYQVKLDVFGYPRLLEVASRLGGSSGLFRCKGVNFALLSLFDAFDQDISIKINEYDIELDRSLDNRFKLNICYQHVFVDLDDCLVIRDRINNKLISFLYKSLSEGKNINLLTRHSGDLVETLKYYRISDLFDKIIKIDKFVKKSDFIDSCNSIFIDDSYSERCEVAEKLNIPVFSPDMVEALL